MPEFSSVSEGKRHFNTRCWRLLKPVHEVRRLGVRLVDTGDVGEDSNLSRSLVRTMEGDDAMLVMVNVKLKVTSS